MTALKVKKMRVNAYFVADFETSHDWRQGLKPAECSAWVWLWTLTKVGNVEREKVEHGFDILSFLKRCDELSQNKTIVVFFHNLKYDGSYLLNVLREEAETLIDNFGRFYQIKWNNVYFWDSLKKINNSVEKIGESFKTQHRKIKDFDYSSRPAGYIANAKEIEYAENDVLVMSEALSVLLKNGMHGMTVSGDAFKLAKNSIGWKKFPKLFPPNDELDRLIRPAYFGGWVYLNPKYAEKEINRDFFIYDVNSEYPAICVNELLPYGKPVFVDKIPRGLFIIRFKALAKLKPGFFPFVSMKGNFRYVQTELLTATDGLECFTMTSVDYFAFLKYYDVDIYKIEWILSFKSARGIFKDFILENYDIKSNSEGAVKEVAKLKMNSFTGRMAMNPERKSKDIRFEDDVLRFCDGELNFLESIYTAYTAFITAYGRRYVHDRACALGDDFIYSDTDSVHSFIAFPADVVDSVKLGKFKLENICKKGKYLRAKTYMFTNNKGQTRVKCAGLPDEGKKLITYDNFNVGLKLEGVKKQAHQAKGGIILTPGPFQIRI